MSRARFALLFTLILGLVLSSCHSLRMDAPTSTPAPAWQLRSPVLHYDSLWGAAWPAGGEMLAVADPKGVHFINRQTLQEEYLSESGFGVTPVAYSRDGRLLATCTRSNTVLLWDGEGRQLLRTLDASRMLLSTMGLVCISGTWIPARQSRCWNRSTLHGAWRIAPMGP